MKTGAGRTWTRPGFSFSRLFEMRYACALLLFAAFAEGLGGCAKGTGPPPHPQLEAVWRDYAALPEERALAIAGELQRNQWVAGASGGHATRAEAERWALRECQKRRAARGMVDPCRLYGVGDERVSSGFGTRPRGSRAGFGSTRGRK